MKIPMLSVKNKQASSLPVMVTSNPDTIQTDKNTVISAVGPHDSSDLRDADYKNATNENDFVLDYCNHGGNFFFLSAPSVNDYGCQQHKLTFLHQIFVLTSFVILAGSLQFLSSNSSFVSRLPWEEDIHILCSEAVRWTTILVSLYIGWHSWHPAASQSTSPILLMAVGAIGCLMLNQLVDNIVHGIGFSIKFTSTFCILCFSVYFALHAYQKKSLFAISFFLLFSFALVVMIATIPHASEIVHIWCFAALWAALYAVPYCSSSSAPLLPPLVNLKIEK